MTPDEAKGMAQRLLARYPGMKAHDALTYAAEMVTVFAAYPLAVGKRVIDPVHGALAQSKYTPSVPEVNRSLAAEMDRRERIKANARAHIIEAKRRREALAEAARTAEFERNRSTPEHRAKVVAEALKSFNRMEPNANGAA